MSRSSVLVTVVGIFLAASPARGQDAEPKDVATSEKPTKNVAIFVFPDVQIIDFAGPYEVFANAAAAHHSYFNVFTVATKDDLIETSGGLTIQPKYRLDNHPKVDILVLPGGWGVGGARADATVIEWIQKTAESAELVFSICNGAKFLARAGLLDGKEATTNANALDGLQREVPTAKVLAGKRFVDSGKVVTAGGLSAGIDGALHVIERSLGKGWGEMVAVWLEYDRRPSAECSWGLLADRWLPNPIIDWQEFTGVWTPLQYSGGTDHWENKARFESALTAEELRTGIAGNVTKYLKWSPRENGSAEQSGKSLWGFQDEGGRNWHATLTIVPARDEARVLDVTVRIDLQARE